MGAINPIFNDRVRYTLNSKNSDSLIVTEPIGWNDDEKEYSRHEKYHGIIAKFSNSLKFIDKGADYIQLILDLYGINEEIELIREEKHPQTDVWTLTYSGFLDLSTWAKENNQVSVKFNSGGIEQLLKSRESEKVEIDRLTTIDGKIIPALIPIDVELEGRRVFLKTNFKNEAVNNYVNTDNQTNGQTRGSTYPVPITIINKSHEQAHSPILGTRVGDDTWERTGNGETGLMFFTSSDKQRTLRIKLNLKLKTKFAEAPHPFYPNQNVIVGFDDINYFMFGIRLGIYSGGVNYNHKGNIFLLSTDNFDDVHYKTRQFSFDQTITIDAGDSIGLLIDQNMDGENGHSAHLWINIYDVECELTIDENSFFEKTQTKAVLAHELGSQLVAISTNKNKAFYSDFLGRTDIGYPIDGKASLTGFAHGFWIRNFDKLPLPVDGPPRVENMFKPLSTSFKDYVNSLSVVWNVGVGIEKVGFSEIVRIEDLSYFYNRNTTIKLPNQVKNVKRTIAVDKYYSALEFGYAEGGDYEEACGLDEFNAKSNFTTVINRLKNSYTKISEYRADSYGMEFTRRKQKSLNNTEDTSRDNSIWFLDLKRGLNNIFSQRKWQDDFEVIPTGVFSPETATNLRFSPVNCLLRHSWWFSGGFKKYLADYVRYGSSTANSQLKTKFIGKNEYAENGNIINSELQSARFLPEEIEFEHVCDFNVMQQVNGITTILGKKIPNFYGLVEFVNEENEIEKGFLFNLKPNGKGSWKLIKANR